MAAPLAEPLDPWIAAGFPNYDDGNVHITLPSSPPTTVHLYTTKLMSNSGFFAEVFKELEKAKRTDKSKDDVLRFKIIPNKREGLSFVLVPESSNMLHPPENALGEANELGNSLLFEEADHVRSDIKKLDGGKSVLKDMQCIDAWRNFFSAVHGLPPKLDASSITTTLADCEALVDIALHCEGLPAIRMYATSALNDQPHALYRAIAGDPVRWLNLSVRLESKALFREAFTHCVGGFPRADWPTPVECILPHMWRTVESKAEKLSAWMMEVELKLLKTTLSDGRVPASPEHGSGSFLVVSMFRDWFLNQTRFQERQGRKYHYAEPFRHIAKGGDAYLKVEEMSRKVSAFFNGSPYSLDIQASLDVLKKKLQLHVAPLVKNNLLIEAESRDNGVPYLTCIEVNEEDIPWGKPPILVDMGSAQLVKWLGAALEGANFHS